MHHKAKSFHSQNLFLKSAVYAHGCWQVYSMEEENNNETFSNRGEAKGEWNPHECS